MDEKSSTTGMAEASRSGILTRRSLLKAGLGAAAAGVAAPLAAPRVWAKSYPALGTYPAGVGAKSVFVGGLMPLTGPYAEIGADQRRGFELAVAHLNGGSRVTEAIPTLKKGGGVLGKKIEFGLGDTQTRPDPAVQAATQFIDGNHAILLIGAISSAVDLAVEELAQRNKVIYLIGLSAADSTTGKNCQRFAFRSEPPAYMFAEALAPVLGKHLGRNLKAAYLFPDYVFGYSVYNQLTRFTGNYGWKAVSKQVSPLGTTDFSTYLLNIANSGAEIFVNETFGADFVTSSKQAEQFGIFKKMKYLLPLIPQFASDDLGPEIMGGVYGHQPWWWTEENTYPLAKYFVEDFYKKHHYKPRWAASEVYLQMIVWADAVERAGTFYPAAVIKALESGHKVDTIYGQVWYRGEDHQMVRPVPIMVGKTKAEMKGPEDYYQILTLEPGEKLLPPLAETGCHMPSISAI